MKLTLIRDTFDAASTIGKLSIDGAFFCDTLEDTVRAPGVKVPGKTAIPCGTYRVVIDESNRFRNADGSKRLMPHVLDVPGFEGIRIHSGNTDADTEGCILVGRRSGKADWISESRVTFTALFSKLLDALGAHKEEVMLTVSGAPKEYPS